MMERPSEVDLAWFTPTDASTVPHPFLVAEIGTVIGWVRSAPWRPREAYRRIAECSAYVATATQRQVVGDALMAAFLLTG